MIGYGRAGIYRLLGTVEHGFINDWDYGSRIGLSIDWGTVAALIYRLLIAEQRLVRSVARQEGRAPEGDEGGGRPAREEEH